MTLREDVAGKFMVQCQKGEDFECPYLETCPHEDKDICLWQLESADTVLSLLRQRVEEIGLAHQEIFEPFEILRKKHPEAFAAGAHAMRQAILRILE